MNNVKFKDSKTGQVTVVKVCQPSITTMGRHWNNQAKRRVLTLPTLARAHLLMLRDGFVRCNRKAA